MKIAFWIVATVLGLLYLYAGALKVGATREQLKPMMQWVDSTPMWLVRAIGVIEILGVGGLVLPPATLILPWLAIVAAIGFVVLQVLATGVHLARGEGIKQIPINLVLLALAAVATWLATAW